MLDRALNRFAQGSLLSHKQRIHRLIADLAMAPYQGKLVVLHAAYKINRKEDFRTERSPASSTRRWRAELAPHSLAGRARLRQPGM